MKLPRISGKPDHNKLRIAKDRTVPAYNYELFIDRFEQFVAERQSEIRKLEQMEQIYNLVVKALKDHSFTTAHTINLFPSHLTVRFELSHRCRLSDFEAFALEVGQRLYHHNLHRDGKPANSGWEVTKVWSYRLTSLPNYPSIYIEARVPLEGCLDYEVHSTIRSYTSTEYTLVPRTPSFHTKGAQLYDESNLSD